MFIQFRFIVGKVSRPIRNTMHKKSLKFALIMELAQLKFTYTYHSSKNTSSRPPLGMSSEYNSVQRFSGFWLN